MESKLYIVNDLDGNEPQRSHGGEGKAEAMKASCTKLSQNQTIYYNNSHIKLNKNLTITLSGNYSIIIDEKWEETRAYKSAVVRTEDFVKLADILLNERIELRRPRHFTCCHRKTENVNDKKVI